MEVELHSPALVKEARTENLISNFESSREWLYVGQVFKKVLLKSEEGAYGENPGLFFKEITEALDFVNQILAHHREVLVDEIHTIRDEARTQILLVVASMGGFALILLFLIVFVVKNLTSKLKEVIVKLTKGSSEVDGLSSEVEKISLDLSEAASEQASSVQETVSSMDEISSMIQKNAESAALSSDASKNSNRMAQDAKGEMNEMLNAMEEIGQSNLVMESKIGEVNNDLGKIAMLISTIGDKTKVINDIVFQTKLLSFNASVEAARAGESGKGFAVVAEEVGNLASMSGSAAVEIAEMLEGSIAEVNKIIKSSKEGFESLMITSKQKVERGSTIAKKSDEALTRIIENIDTVNRMIEEISVASQEQSTGVVQVSKAMEQLDQATHQNATAAQSAEAIIAKLKVNSNDLSTTVDDLLFLVNPGSKSASTRSKVEVTKKPVVVKKAKDEVSVPDENDSRFEEI